MFARKSFIATEMSGQSGLHRSSWKVEAIRRGDLKISGPIPIHEDASLNDEVEESTGQPDLGSQSQDAMVQQDRRPRSLLKSPQSPSNVFENPTHRNSDHMESHSQQQETSRVPQLVMSPLRMHQVNAIPQEHIVQPISPASPTPFRATPESMTKAMQRRNRKSGLRHVFRKILGRRDRDKAEEHEEESVQRGHVYHASVSSQARQDSGPLRRSPPREPQTPSEPRISDVPVQESRPIRPLGLQLPFPMNVNASPANLAFDDEKPGIVRRVTLPNARSSTVQRHSIDGSRGRLSPWGERQDEDSSLPEIGIALTIPGQARSSVQSKRRSRSVDALHDLSKARASIDRSRSADIRYWRESCTSESTFSLYTRPQTAKTTEMVQSVPVQEPDIQQPEQVTEVSAIIANSDDPEEPEADEVLGEQNEQKPGKEPAPVVAFNFGDSLYSPYANDNLSETREPSIPARSEKRLSIEDRVKHLESGLNALEVSMRRISTRNNRQTIILENAPKHLRSRNRSSSRSISTISIHDQPIIHQACDDAIKHTSPSPSFMPNSELNDSRELAAVYETLTHERTARRALEVQVRTLQHDVADLRILVDRLFASTTVVDTSYTASSPDSSHHECVSTPRAARHKALVTIDMRESIQSRFSRTDSESTTEECEQRSFSNSRENLTSPGDWATPSEGAFLHNTMPTTPVT